MKSVKVQSPAGRKTLIAKLFAGLTVLVVVTWAVWSYLSHDLMYILLAGANNGGTTLEALRAYVRSWGALAPFVYTGAVTAEVLVAPIPGLLLYAPGGAIFGGFVGGALALVGNTLGAMIAAFLAQTLGASWLAAHVRSPRFAAIRERLANQGAWIIFLLRLNPLTSSDVVSYAAGLAGMSARRVALGTFFGMLPLCFLQAYLAETVFEFLPFPVIVVGTFAVMGILVWVMFFRDVARD
jgi:uncharacterized membrane protein YdjX (TVP38/TMEM64 family)